MENATPNSPRLKVLFATEGSGGHLIPALEVAQVLAASHHAVQCWYPPRQRSAALAEELIQRAKAIGVHVDPIQLPPAGRLRQLWQAGSLWRVARRRLKAFQPQVVVGFGGRFCMPVVVAARQQRIPVLLHEQNVLLGRANRLLLRMADQIALSFDETRAHTNGTPAVTTGLPVRSSIGAVTRDHAAQRFGLDPHALTILVLGGSQGAQALNRLIRRLVAEVTDPECRRWQFLHLTGPSDHADLERAFHVAGIRAWVVPHLADMGAAYALADVVLARAGASTIAELAQCAKPAVLIPYPYAHGHQRANARMVESLGAGIRLEEASATPQRLFVILRQLLGDERLRRMMGTQMRTLARPDAAHHLAGVIVRLGQRDAQR